MDRSFSRWRPGMPPAPGGSLKPALDSIYDLDGVSMGADGFTFTMVPDGLRRWELAGQKILLTWEYILAFQITQETYREDCWVSQPEDAWSFYVSACSPLLADFRRKSGFFPEKAFHFLLVGTSLVADILAEGPPQVRFVEGGAENTEGGPSRP